MWRWSAVELSSRQQNGRGRHITAFCKQLCLQQCRSCRTKSIRLLLTLQDELLYRDVEEDVRYPDADYSAQEARVNEEPPITSYQVISCARRRAAVMQYVSRMLHSPAFLHKNIDRKVMCQLTSRCNGRRQMQRTRQTAHRCTVSCNLHVLRKLGLSPAPFPLSHFFLQRFVLRAFALTPVGCCNCCTTY